MSIDVSLSLFRKLQLPDQLAFTSNWGFDGQVMMSSRESRKASLFGQYFEHLKPDDELDLVVVAMKAYDLVLGFPWFKLRNTEID
jgi:hypothetical protein